MKYLLDVNVLLALAVADHEFHLQVVRWLKPARGAGRTGICTCSITELGVVRILCQSVYGRSIPEAKGILRGVKAIRDLEFTFLPDDQSALELPSWVGKSTQVTDGHLWTLAKKHGVSLATLDRGIPGAVQIPA